MKISKVIFHIKPKIGIYKSENDVALLHSEFQMSAEEFHMVVDTNMWVALLVIDCYTVTHMDKWKDENISYMPTDIANKAIGNFAAKRKGTKIGIFQNPNPAQRQITHTIRI